MKTLIIASILLASAGLSACKTENFDPENRASVYDEYTNHPGRVSIKWKECVNKDFNSGARPLNNIIFKCFNETK